MEINGRDSEGLWHIYLDEDFAEDNATTERYPLTKHDALPIQLWALLPEQ